MVKEIENLDQLNNVMSNSDKDYRERGAVEVSYYEEGSSYEVSGD